MAVGDREDILHRIKARLFTHSLKNVTGKYIARTENEASLGITDICTTMKNRGGYLGKPEDAEHNASLFLDEVAYQILDGYGVNLKYFNLYLNIGGAWEGADEAHDHNKHRVTLRLRITKLMYDLIRRVKVVITEVMEEAAWIHEFYDEDEKVTNSIFVAQDTCTLTGHKIKIEGEDPSCGLYFVNANDPTQRVKVTRIFRNNPSELMFGAPDSGVQHCRIEVVTQFTGSASIPLKTPRVITSRFTLEQV